MFKRIAAMLCLLMVGYQSLCLAQASQPSLPDLRANAPQGTFLEPGQQPQVTENSYRSEHIAVNISKQRVANSDVTVADIYVANVGYLRRALGNDKWKGGSQRVTDMVLSNQAIVAISGDYASLLTAGLVAANGEILRKSPNKQRDNALLFTDGTMVTFGRGKLTSADFQPENLWHAFLFGPALLGPDGQALEKIRSNVGVANPRSVIGYYAPGHYCFVVVDGRTSKNRGLTMTALSKLMADLGCKAAYNLDGGQSAMMVFRGAVVSDPYKGGREVTDIVYIAE